MKIQMDPQTLTYFLRTMSTRQDQVNEDIHEIDASIFNVYTYCQERTQVKITKLSPNENVYFCGIGTRPGTEDSVRFKPDQLESFIRPSSR